MQKISKLVYFTLGFSTTTPLLAIVVGGHVLTLMYIMYILVFGNLLFIGGKRTFKLNNESILYKNFYYYLILSIFSCLFGAVFFVTNQKDYALASIGFIPKILIYLSFLILLYINKNCDEKVHYILKGILYGAFVNVVWSIVDAIVFYTSGTSITNELFINVIEGYNLLHSQASSIEGLYIRSSGLTIDQCSIGYYAIGLTAYGLLCNKRWIIVLSVISCFASVSFVGFVGIAIVVSAFFIKSKNVIRNLLKLSFISLLLGGLYIQFSENELITNLNTAVQMRAESKAENDASASTRKLFIQELPEAIMNLPTSLFIGTGHFSASYAYYPLGLSYSRSDKYHMKPVPIENMYIETLFASGIIGLALFVLFYFRILKYTRRAFRLYGYRDLFVIIYSFTLAALVLFMFYHAVYDSTIMLLSICAAVILKNESLSYNNVTTQ